MRVTVLTNIYPPHHYGGYEQACDAVVRRWRDAGHDVQVATGDHRVGGVESPDPPWITRGLRFYWRDHEVVEPSGPTRLRWELANRKLWAEVLDRHEPEVVSVWNHGLMSYQLLAEVEARKIPLVLVVADDWLTWGPRWDLWTRMFDDRSSVRRMLGRLVTTATGLPTTYPHLAERTSVLFASSWLDQRAREGSRFTPEQRAIVPWGVDTANFPVLDAPARPAPVAGTGHLVLVGRVDERKGVLTAARALDLLPDGVTLEVVGPSAGPARARLDALVAELGLGSRVMVHHLPAGEVAARYSEADVALFPSEWEEPFGLVGLEAMASAVPLVATGTGGSSDYLRHEGNALLVPPGDPAALAAAVGRLLGDGDLRAALVEEGRATARALTLDRMAAELESWHAAAIAGQRA